MTRETRALKRNVRVDTDIAVLGDSLGRTTENLQKGLIRVRRRTGSGLGTPEIIRSFGGSPYPLIPGCEVHVGRDLGGRLAVLGPTFEWMLANGYDPNYLNSGNPRYDWVDLRNAIPLRSFASQPPSLSVSIGPLRWIDHDKIVHEFPGANIDLTADIPAADNHGLIVTYILDDESAGYQASTPKALPESVNPVGLADIQECVTAAPDDAIWSGIWHVKNDQGTVTAHDLYDDLRQWINIPGVGSGSLDDAVIKAPDSSTRNTITPTAAANPALIITPFSTSHPVNLVSVGNNLGGTAFAIRNRATFTNLLEVGFLGQTIVSGAVNAWASRLLIRAQTGTTDDLDTINDESENGHGVIFLQPDAGDTITVKHGTGNINTIDSSDYDLSGADIMILIHFDSVWHQVNYLPGQALPASSIASGMVSTEFGGTGADNSTNTEGDTLLSNGANGNYVTSPLPPGMRNPLLDPRMEYWPNGTSDTGVTDTYASSMVRIRTVSGGGTGSISWSRQAFTVGQTDVPFNPNFFLRISGNYASGDATEFVGDTVAVEDVQSYSGQTITFSLWLKAGSAGTIGVNLFQNFGSGGSTLVWGTGQTQAITTSWVRYHFTFTVPSVSGKTIGTGSHLAFRVFKQLGATRATEFGFGGAVNLTSDLDSWGRQVDRGGIMTQFDNRPAWIDLQLSERYIWKIDAHSEADRYFGMGFNASTTSQVSIMQFPTKMRTAPTLTTSGSFEVHQQSSTIAITGIALGQVSEQVARVNSTVAAGLTAGNGTAVRADNDTSSYWIFDARF